jgi:hypothetical protein
MEHKVFDFILLLPIHFFLLFQVNYGLDIANRFSHKNETGSTPSNAGKSNWFSEIEKTITDNLKLPNSKTDIAA